MAHRRNSERSYRAELVANLAANILTIFSIAELSSCCEIIGRKMGEAGFDHTLIRVRFRIVSEQRLDESEVPTFRFVPKRERLHTMRAYFAKAQKNRLLEAERLIMVGGRQDYVLICLLGHLPPKFSAVSMQPVTWFSSSQLLLRNISRICETGGVSLAYSSSPCIGGMFISLFHYYKIRSTFRFPMYFAKIKTDYARVVLGPKSRIVSYSIVIQTGTHLML